jgi:hypothetical protein
MKSLQSIRQRAVRSLVDRAAPTASRIVQRMSWNYLALSS